MPSPFFIYLIFINLKTTTTKLEETGLKKKKNMIYINYGCKINYALSATTLLYINPSTA